MPAIYFLILSAIIVLSLLLRVYNLNYNSPFQDEAIYIVIGKMGTFYGDWSTFNAASWMAGQFYLYPVLTSIAYNSFGILGSRFLNIIFGILTVELFFYLGVTLSGYKDNRKYLSGVITAAIIGFSTISLYISRLATYDMLSFYLLFLSIALLIKAETSDQNLGKKYFLSSIVLILSFLTKAVTVLYIPLIVIYSFINLKNLTQKHNFFWKRYFLSTIIFSLFLFLLLNFNSLLTYTNSQIQRDKTNIISLLFQVWDNLKAVLLLFILASFGYLSQKKFKNYALLVFCALWIIFFHLIIQRAPTFDKHLFLTTGFLALIIGPGLTELVYLNTKTLFKYYNLTILALVLLTFIGYSYLELYKFNILWENSNQAISTIQSKIKNGDKVLSEEGPPIILASFDKNFPTNISTFDWFEYRNFKNDEAYTQAVKDGYFKYIELQNSKYSKESNHHRIHQIVQNNMSGNYKLVFEDNGFQIYERNF